jgi:hypothetical protein
MTDYNEQDDRIAAYLDGQMSGAELAAFEAELENNPALAAALARYSANDSLLRAAFDAPMQQPVDDALLVRMGLGEPAAANLVNLAERRDAKPLASAANDNAGWQRWRWPTAGAVAAALVVAVMTQTGQAPAIDPQFAKAMESLPSGQSTAIASGETVQPLLTFKAGDGRFCREFSRQGAAAATGIACRGNAGWIIEAETGGATNLPDGGQIQTAEGADSNALDKVYDSLKASDPLDGKTENALISSGWESAGK